MTQKILEDIHDILQAIPYGNEDAVWKSFYSIKTDLEFDIHSSKQEIDILHFLNSNLADAVKIRSLGLISPKLAALKSSIERRTTGRDSWPIRA